MNYFLNMHGGIVFFTTLIIVFLAMGVVFFFCLGLGKRFNLSERIDKVFTVGCTMSIMLIGFWGTSKVLNNYNEGGINKLYILNQKSAPRLTIWFTKIHNKRLGADYNQHLKTYDLYTGEVLGSAEMVKKYHSNEYRLFKSNSNKVWGYSSKTGIQLLDLAKPELMAGEDDFLKWNPQLGKKIKLYSGDDIYDPETNGIHVVTSDGQIYRLNVDMKASVVGYVPDQPSSEEEGLTFAKDWRFYYLDDDLGKHVHWKKTKCSAESVSLLEPKFVKELNKSVHQKNKAWVIHKSAIYGKSDPLLSFVDPNGEERVRINLQQMFENEKALKVLGTYTRENEVFIFVSSGETYLRCTDGFTLTALRADPQSGKMLGQIKYF